DVLFFFFQAEDGIRDDLVTGVQTCALPISVAVHRDTILRLMVRVANGCAAYSDRTLRDLGCQRIELDEIWAYVAKKQKNVGPMRSEERRVGKEWRSRGEAAPDKKREPLTSV